MGSSYTKIVGLILGQMGHLRKQTCLVIGKPRGFTRSVLEALLKRGSKVMFTYADNQGGKQELSRLSTLYGSQQVQFTALDQNSTNSMDSVFLKAMGTFGEISFIVNSTINDTMEGLKEVNGKDVEASNMSKASSLATKYMGKQNGYLGGTLLTVSNQPVDETKQLLEKSGLAKSLSKAGVKTCTVYRPDMDYPDRELQITDDQHSPYYSSNKYNSSIRDYTGYMAVHVGQTCAPGTEWAFNKSLKLEEIRPIRA